MDILFVIVFCVIVVFFLKDFFGMSSMQSSLFKKVDKALDMNLKEREAKLKEKQDYQCNNCNATVEDPSNISPSGDVKCHQCDSWFNVYQN